MRQLFVFRSGVIAHTRPPEVLLVRQLPDQARRHGARLRDSQPIAVPAMNGHHERLISDVPDHRDVVGIATLPRRDSIEADLHALDAQRRRSRDIVCGLPDCIDVEQSPHHRPKRPRLKCPVAVAIARPQARCAEVVSRRRPVGEDSPPAESRFGKRTRGTTTGQTTRQRTACACACFSSRAQARESSGHAFIVGDEPAWATIGAINTKRAAAIQRIKLHPYTTQRCGGVPSVE